MRKWVIGLSLLMIVVSASADTYTGNPGFENVLSLSGGVSTFTENYEFTDDATLGAWASKTYMYRGLSQDSGYGANHISLFPAESPVLLYSFIIPAEDVTVDFSVSLRCGATMRVASNVGSMSDLNGYFWADSLLAVGEKRPTDWNFTEYTGTIPSSMLNVTSVPGQTSFSLLIYNGTGEWNAAGIDQLTITAVPEPATIGLLMTGIFGAILKRRRS